MDISKILAVDVHAHVGAYTGAKAPLLDTLYSGSFDTVLGRAREAGVRCTFVSPLKALLPRYGGDPTAGNRELAREIGAHPGIYQWVVVDPLKPDTYAQAAEILKSSLCVGIKIHPEEHGYPIAEHGERIFRFAAEQGAIVQSHSGEQRSLPEDFLPFADDFPGVTIILSHLGCGFDGDVTRQVRAVQKARHGNVYTDTSSATSITRGLIEWAVKEIGRDRIMFGTDTPLYDAPMHRARINNAEISDAAKQAILCGNAERVFGRIVSQQGKVES